MFGPKTFLEPHIEDWVFETWGWLARNVDASARNEWTLVQPTGAFFPKLDAKGHELAVAVFDRVKQYMGIAAWPCELVPQESRRLPTGPMFGEQKSHGPAGTFQNADGQFIISYDPELLRRPYALVATLAHECAHYVLHGAAEEAPGAAEEPMMNELATDLCVAFHGFGLFGANAAFEFEQFQGGGVQGWRSQRLGYLTEDTWVFATALFLALRGGHAENARRHLKPNLAKRFDKAAARLQRAATLLAALQ